MNQQQKNLLLNKLKASKDAEVLFTSDYDKNSVKLCLTELNKILSKSPAATIIIIKS